MERMRELQESLLREEGASQEEMETRFELEKSESLLVTPSGTGSRVSGLGAASLYILLTGADTPPHTHTHVPSPFKRLRLASESWSVSPELRACVTEMDPSMEPFPG